MQQPCVIKSRHWLICHLPDDDDDDIGDDDDDDLDDGDDVRTDIFREQQQLMMECRKQGEGLLRFKT